MRYKTWRSRKDPHLHVLCKESAEAFEALPVAIRNLGPWTGGPEGDIDRLRLPYRLMLGEQGFAILYSHVSQLQLEVVASVHVLHPANTECPTCKGSGDVPQHGGLRMKTCPRCAGAGSRRQCRADSGSAEERKGRRGVAQHGRGRDD